MTAYKYLTTESRDGVLIVRIQAEKLIDPADVHAFDIELARVVRDDTPRAMLIDFQVVARIATGVINTLLLAKKNILAHGGDFVVSGMRQNIRHTCRLLRLDGTIFQIFDNEEEALAHFKVDT